MSFETFRKRLEESYDFPTEITIKVIGHNHPAFRPELRAALETVIPGCEPTISERPSRGDRHVSITFTVTMPHADAVIASYEAFRGVAGVKVLL